MQETKSAIRKALISKRLSMDKLEVAKKTKIITQKLIKSVEWGKLSKIHVYTSLAPLNEIDTTQFQAFIAKQWPKIELSTSPARKDALIPVQQFDLIIVPVLGFDKNNYRLGMGGGWYDRFLSGQKNAKTIGLAYNDSYLENIPVESHDIPMHKIITEK